jgi:hypothetical protein
MIASIHSEIKITQQILQTNFRIHISFFVTKGFSVTETNTIK